VTYAETRRLPYSIELAHKPAVWGTAVVVAVLSAVASTSMIVPIVSAVLLALTTGILATCRTIRHRLDVEWHKRERRQHRDERETRLEQASIRRAGLATLTELTDAITRCDPSAAERLELERLLDQYAEMAIASERWRNVVGREDVCRQLRARPHPGTLHHELVDRRLAHAQHCLDQWCALQEQLAVIHELIAIYTIRSAIDAKLGS
jgi:hypothetical protein